MDSIDIDTLHRAFVDLQTLCSQESLEKESQRIADLTAEIKKKAAKVRTLEDMRSDALKSADLLRHETPGLAFAFERRADILLDEIERIKPKGEMRKLEDALSRKRSIETIGALLDAADLEVING